MYDHDRAKELENKSHVRGLLAKEFYQLEHAKIERQRQEMKKILDEQMEEKRRKKELEKQELDRINHLEDQRIREYLNKQTQEDNVSRGRVSSKNKIIPIPDGNLPLMSETYFEAKSSVGSIPLLDLSEEPRNSRAKKVIMKSNKPTKREGSSAGTFAIDSKNKFEEFNNKNINSADQFNKPHLDRKTEQNLQFKNNSLEKIKFGHEQSKLSHDGSRAIYGDSRAVYSQLKGNENLRSIHENDRNSHEYIKNEQSRNLVNSRIPETNSPQKNYNPLNEMSSRHNTETIEDVNTFENENHLLKEEIKKKQEVISLLIGAVRTNPKLEKFRVQAEKILNSGFVKNTKNSNESSSVIEGPTLLPKLKLKHQSIMHDYILDTAPKRQSKTFGPKK